MSEAAPRRRIVIDLGQGDADGAGIEAAALFARLLGHDLLGIFVEDEALLTLAAHPFARELRLPSHAWTMLESGALAAGLGLAAARLRRRMAAECARLGVPGGFEVRRGDVAGAVAELCRAADIVALGAPDSVAGRAIGSFPNAWRAALASEAGVLLLPQRVVRRRGPGATVAGDGEGEEVALRLAAASGETLLLLAPAELAAPEEAAAALARRAGLVPPRMVTRRLAGAAAGALAEALGRAEESVLVITRRGGWAQDAPALAARRRVPVLVR